MGKESTLHLMRQLGALIGLDIDEKPVQRMVLEVDIQKVPKLHVQYVVASEGIIDFTAPGNELHVFEGPVVVEEGCGAKVIAGSPSDGT